MSATLVDLGASGLNPTTNAVWASCKGSAVDDDGDADDFGQAPMMAALGVVAKPAPANERGSARGVVMELEGVPGVLVGGYDPRTANVFGAIGPGETGIGATGEGFEARTFYKDQLIALLVGDDHVVSIDRKNKQIVINCPGGAIKVSQEDGIVLCAADGGASLQLKDGVSALIGQVLLGGRSPKGTMAWAEAIEAELEKIALAFKTFSPGSGGASFVQPYAGGANVKAQGVSFGG